MPEISDNDQNTLRMLAGLTEQDELPAKLKEAFCRVKRLHCRISHGVLDAASWCLIGTLAGLGESIKGDTPTISPLEKFQALGLERGERIVVNFRNKETECEYLSVDAAGKIVVKFDDKMNPYRLAPDSFLRVCEGVPA